MKAIKAWLKLNSLVLLALIAMVVVIAACCYSMAVVYGWWAIVFTIACILGTYILCDK